MFERRYQPFHYTVFVMSKKQVIALYPPIPLFDLVDVDSMVDLHLEYFQEIISSLKSADFVHH